MSIRKCIDMQSTMLEIPEVVLFEPTFLASIVAFNMKALIKVCLNKQPV